MPPTGPMQSTAPPAQSLKSWLAPVSALLGSRWGTLFRQLIPSSLDLILVTAYLISLTAPVENIDVFGQIEMGKFILQNGEIPIANHFSFTAPDHAWVDNEWLAQVLLYVLSEAMGSHWLVFLRGVCFAGAMGLLYRLLRRMGGVVPALGLTFAAIVVAIPFLRIGPSMVAIPFLVLLLTLLEDGEWRRGASVFLLPPLFLFWANLHGSFFLGLMVLILHIVGAIWDYRKGTGDSMWFYHLMGLMPAVLFSLWNPYYSSIYIQGIGQVWQAFAVVPMWLSTPASLFVFFTVGILAGVTFYLTRLTFKRRLILPLLGVGGFVLIHREVMVEAVIVATVAIMQNLEQLAYQVRHGPETVWQERQETRSWLQGLGDGLKSISAIDRRIDSHTYSYLTGLLTLILFSAADWGQSGLAASISLEERALPEIAPVIATEALIDAAFPRARVLAPIESAGYVMYQGSPEIRTFIDARRGAYPQEILEDYQRFSDMAPGWESILEYHQVDFILWRPNDFQPRALAMSGHWQLLYADPYAVVLGRAKGAKPGPMEMGDPPEGPGPLPQPPEAMGGGLRPPLEYGLGPLDGQRAGVVEPGAGGLQERGPHERGPEEPGPHEPGPQGPHPDEAGPEAADGKGYPPVHDTTAAPGASPLLKVLKGL